MEEMLTVHTPASSDAPFLTQEWSQRSAADAASNGTSSPFPFDLHICDYSGNTPISLPLSASATPAYSDMHNPFFNDFEPARTAQSHALQPAFMAEHVKAEEDGSMLGQEAATYRKRALQRLSLTSSIVSSAPSTAPSENDEDANESDWDSVSLRRSDSSAGDQADALEGGFYSAFALQSLAGPCSFSGEATAPNFSLAHAQSNGTIRANDANTDRKPGHTSALSVFNLADFISDGTHPSDESQQQVPTAADGTAPCKMEPNNFSQIIGIQGLSPNVTAVKVEEANAAYHAQAASLHATPTRLGARFDAISLGATPDGPSAPTSQYTAAGSSTSYLDPTVGFVADSAAAACDVKPAFPAPQRSMSFHGYNGPVEAPQMMTPERPLVHPSLIRVGKPETPTRSQSSPNIHDPLSCNPAHITPGSSVPGAAPATFVTTTNGHASPAFAQNLFGANADFPDSPASSALSSPPRWACALPGDEFLGEETYCPTQYALGVPALSSSLPTRPIAMRSYSDIHSVPASPNGHGGLAMRPVRSTAGVAPASPYASPSFGSPLSGQHLLPPSHPLAHLQNPYSGVITKRSRGRRVPNTPEEMTNIGKSGKVYTCKVPGCGKLFKRSEHLKRHIRSIHTNEKPYVCQICLKQFSRHDNLNQHMRVHGSNGGGNAGDSNASSAGESPVGSPTSAAASISSRRGSSSASFHETRGGTITRRTLNTTDDGVFDFEQAE